MAKNVQNHAPGFSVTASGTAVAIATQAGTTGQICFVTDISGSSTGTMGTWTVMAGSNILWEGSGAVNYQFSNPLAGTSGASIVVTVNGTTATFANVGGYYLKNN